MTPRRRSAVLAVLALAAYAPALARADLRGDLDRIFDSPALRGALVTVAVTRPDGRVVYARNERMRAMPASNQKLLATAFALDRLGPDFRFRTRFWREGDRIVVDAVGDPTITRGQLEAVAAQLAARGDGAPAAVAVRPAYRVGWPPSWEWDDLGFAYAPRVTALTVDRGVFAVASEAGEVLPLPAGAGVEVVREPAGTTLRVRYDPFARRLAVGGPLPEARTAQGRFALPAPDAAAAAILGAPLAEGVPTLPDREPDAEIVSAPLIEIAAECNTVSDNLYAEALLLAAAGADSPLGDDPYTAAPARAQRWLQEEVGAEAGDFRVYDGSGLSRHNLVTAAGVARLLRWVDRQKWGVAYREGLAAPGRGTLRSRLAGARFQGKTGTLDLVVGLSGYVVRPNGERWMASILINHALGGSAPAREAADAAIRRLETL